jgi:hypothetical protein
MPRIINQMRRSRTHSRGPTICQTLVRNDGTTTQRGRLRNGDRNTKETNGNRRQTAADGALDESTQQIDRAHKEQEPGLVEVDHADLRPHFDMTSPMVANSL